MSDIVNVWKIYIFMHILPFLPEIVYSRRFKLIIVCFYLFFKFSIFSKKIQFLFLLPHSR